MNSNSTKLPVSVCMLTLNEEDRLEKSLTKLSRFAEILVFDSGSTDRTCELCSRAGANIHQVTWEGFGITRRKLFETASQPWILWLDADEVITDALLDELDELFTQEPSCPAYSINRMVFFEGKWIKHGDWFPDWNVRLFKSNTWSMDDRAVHESIKINGNIGKLHGLLEHHSFRDWQDYEKRCNRYAQLWAEQKRNDGKTASHLDAFMHALASFVKGYFLKLGILDGIMGLKIAIGNARAVHRKYALLSSMLKNKKSL